MKKLEGKIVGYKVLSNTTGVDVTVVTPKNPVAADTPYIRVAPITKDTVLERPERLFGSTYKIKAPTFYDHGIFITLNHIYEEGVATPFELFFNTKNRELGAWLETVSLTVTTLFRTRADINHLLDEYRTIQDSKGGYRGKFKSWEEKPKYYTSILGEIADVIEHWLETLEGTNNLKENFIPNINDFLGSAEAMLFPATAYVNEKPTFQEDSYSANAATCSKCGAKAVVLMDGCHTCLGCGDSKCN